MNHRFNARLAKLPACPECNAFELCPCVTSSGSVRAPHRVRERMAAGEIFVISERVAKRARLLRRLRDLVIAIGGTV